MKFFFAGAKGFTIIELIVVIAVMTLLAGIISANVANFVNKSKDVVIKENMSGLVTNSLAYYASHNNKYNDFCRDPMTETVFYFIDLYSENVHCNANNNGWAFCARLHIGDEKAWCTDYSGLKKQIDNGECKDSIHACP